MRYMDWNKLQDLGRERHHHGWEYIANPRAEPNPKGYRVVHGSRHYLIAVMPVVEGIGEKISDADQDNEALYMLGRVQLQGLIPLTGLQGRALIVAGQSERAMARVISR